MRFQIVCLLALALAVSAETNVNLNTPGQCGTSHNVAKDDVIRLLGHELSNSTSCTVNLNSVPEIGCDGLCYMFNHYSEIQDTNVTLTVSNGTDSVIYEFSNPMRYVPVCGMGVSMTTELTLTPDYTYNENATGYMIILDVYHQCGERGTVENIDFAEALLYAKGYYHGAAMKAQEEKTYLEGILLGFGFSCIFVIIFTVGRCYTHYSSKS